MSSIDTTIKMYCNLLQESKRRQLHRIPPKEYYTNDQTDATKGQRKEPKAQENGDNPEEDGSMIEDILGLSILIRVSCISIYRKKLS
jgi:hypothetical protein